MDSGRPPCNPRPAPPCRPGPTASFRHADPNAAATPCGCAVGLCSALVALAVALKLLRQSAIAGDNNNIWLHANQTMGRIWLSPETRRWTGVHGEPLVHAFSFTRLRIVSVCGLTNSR